MGKFYTGKHERISSAELSLMRLNAEFYGIVAAFRDEPLNYVTEAMPSRETHPRRDSKLADSIPFFHPLAAQIMGEMMDDPS